MMSLSTRVDHIMELTWSDAPHDETWFAIRDCVQLEVERAICDAAKESGPVTNPLPRQTIATSRVRDAVAVARMAADQTFPKYSLGIRQGLKDAVTVLIAVAEGAAVDKEV